MPKVLATPKRRVSKEARIWKVHDLKVGGRSDREIARLLAEDPENPTSVSHQQVNNDWHESLDLLRKANEGHAQRQRQLAITRLDVLLGSVWAKAVEGDTEAVGQARLIIADLRRIQGLDGPELGDAQRPIHLQERVTVDYSTLTTTDLATLIDIAKRQPNIVDGVGSVS